MYLLCNFVFAYRQVASQAMSEDMTKKAARIPHDSVDVSRVPPCNTFMQQRTHITALETVLPEKRKKPFDLTKGFLLPSKRSRIRMRKDSFQTSKGVLSGYKRYKLKAQI